MEERPLAFTQKGIFIWASLGLNPKGREEVFCLKMSKFNRVEAKKDNNILLSLRYIESKKRPVTNHFTIVIYYSRVVKKIAKSTTAVVNLTKGLRL